jgi:hypothetical protein
MLDGLQAFSLVNLRMITTKKIARSFEPDEMKHLKVMYRNLSQKESREYIRW